MATKTKTRYTAKLTDPKYRGGAEQYGGARAKLRSVRGKAGEAKCECCGKEDGAAWILKADTPEEEIYIAPDPGKTTHGALRFSRRPEDYERLCNPCRAERGGHAYQGGKPNLKPEPQLIAADQAPKPGRKPRTRKPAAK